MKALKISLAVLLVLAVSLTAVMAGEGEKMDKKMDMSKKDGQSVTLTGEVLDMYCYMAHPDHGQGPDHAKCATSCINKGLPIGFKSDGVVYIITGKDHAPVAEMVAPFAGKQSKIMGTLHEHDGVKAIELASIEAVK